MTLADTERAHRAEKLWRLKLAFESAGHPSPIHYTKLMQNHDYRLEMCLIATQSTHPLLHQLGIELLEHTTEAVPKKAERLPHALKEPALNQDIVETVLYQWQHTANEQPAQARHTVKLLWPLLGVLIIAGGLLGLLFQGSVARWLGNETQVKGRFSGEHHWTADRTWILDGIVFFEPGARLHIEAGTQIKGGPGAALIITRGAMLFARGTHNAPVVFTSANQPGQRQRGDWGGIVMLGSAPVNTDNAHIEGLAAEHPYGKFGGQDPASGCGVLEFVRIEYAGFEAFTDNELNGLTLGGCGAATLIRNVQVHRALDDGIEVFGGNVDLKNIVITGAGDDSLDWDLGWTGRVQFLIAQQYADKGDSAFEGDNQQRNPFATPTSRPVMHNITLISPDSADRYQRAMTLRRGTAGEFHNVLLHGYADDTIDLQDSTTIDNIHRQRLSFSHIYVHSQRAIASGRWFADEHEQNDDNGFDEAQFFHDVQQQFLFANKAALPPEATSEIMPRYTPVTGILSGKFSASIPQEEFWEEGANYAGAARPGMQRGWWEGWTAFSVN